ncbi:MAG: deoxyribonuclease V [Fimbriimonas sp.]
MARSISLHDWNVSPEEAVALQRELASRVVIESLTTRVETIAGCDISFNGDEERVFAGIVVLALPGLELVEQATVETIATFPYVPGLLSFREIPALMEAWAKLEREPDAVMLDGQGIAHPRRMGIACHFGLLVDRPTIGCAKSPLAGRFEAPGPERGDRSPIVHRGDVVGAAVRSKPRSKPLIVSPGHRCDVESAVALVMACGAGYRLPEPTRRAHLRVNEVRRAAGVPPIE